MFEQWKRRRAQKRVKPGDGHALKPYRWWQPLSRALFHIRLPDEHGRTELWSVSVGLWGDEDGRIWSQLYREGIHVAKATTPAQLPVPGGRIEVGAGNFGLKRCHFVAIDGSERQLAPDPRSAEGHRARLDRRRPVLSRTISAVSVLVLLVALALGIPQLIEQITQIPPVAERFGTFESPIMLPAWANTGLVIAAVLASIERALRLRYNWLLDGGLFDGEE